MKKQIAIKVENEREFKALMAHYESKGWVWSNGYTPTYQNDWNIISNSNKIISYENYFMYSLKNNGEGYTVIDFLIFAQIAGIELPPNKITIEIDKNIICVIEEDGILFKEDKYPDFKLFGKSLEEIYTAYKSLQ